MRIKKVNRYCCDFCPKKTLTRHSMVNHELHCTLNPARSCRMCAYLAKAWDTDHPAVNPPMDVLIAALPPVPSGDLDLSESEVFTLLEPLRKAARDCPACILAALRQSGFTVCFYFDYQTEVKGIFAELTSELDNNERY